MEEFTIKTIGGGIFHDIENKGFPLSKTGISSWLKDKFIIEEYEDLLIFEELSPWQRMGEETYSTTFSFTTNKMTYWLIAKAFVTLNPEKSLLDWKRRRNILSDNNIPVSNWIWTGDATVIEYYYPKTCADIINFIDLIKMAFLIDRLGFITLKFTDDIRCDYNGNPFYVDFGFDLGEPSGIQQNTAKKNLIEMFPDKEKEIDLFYFTNL